MLCRQHALLFFCSNTVLSVGFRLDTDAWLKEYDKCKDLTQEIVQNIQVHPC